MSDIDDRARSPHQQPADDDPQRKVAPSLGTDGCSTVPTPLTPEQVKAFIDAQDWAWQVNLYNHLKRDPNSVVAQQFLSWFSYLMVRIERLEALAGLTPGDIDPEGLLRTAESEKQAKKRLGKLSVGAVKQARRRARQRMQRLNSTMPGVETQGGRVVSVTERPVTSQVTPQP